MKRLRNIAIYYILLGIACLFVFALFGLSIVALVGIVLLIVYAILRYSFNIKEFSKKIPDTVSFILDIFLVALPFMVVFGAQLYYERPYKQIIILPKAYEGIVVVEYDKSEGQVEKWNDGYRVIKVDAKGYGCTQFKPLEDRVGSLEGTKVYFENDLEKELPIFYSDNNYNSNGVLELKTACYVADFGDYRNIFVITSDYKKYFEPNTFNNLKEEFKKTLQ